MQITTSFTPQENSQIQINQEQHLEKPAQSGGNKEVSLYNAPTGSVFQGDILNVQGNQVSIQVGKNILSAMLENGANVNIGDRLSFLIKDNTGTKILLKPFSENGEAMQNSLIKILDEAALPATERTMAAVKEMMSYGMPVDKESMADIGRLLNQFKDTSVETIISLKSHDIPVTQENIAQFEAYKNAQGKLLDQMNGMVKELYSMVENSADTQSLEKTGEFLGKLKELFQNIGEQAANNQEPDGRVRIAVSQTEDNIVKTPVLEEQAQGAEKAQTENSKTARDTQINAQGEISSVNQENTQKNDSIHQINSQSDSQSNTQSASQSSTQPNSQIANPADNLSEKAISELKQHLSDEVKKIETAIKEKLLLTPEQLADKGEKAVKELYENIAKAADKMTQLLESSGEGKSKLMTAAGDLKNNMNFMSDLNEMAAYVQLPVKLNGREQTGELYVLSRKKNKSSKDGPLTAFLHLDMENLGATDVKVSLVNGKVSTKFSLDNDASVKLVETHLPELKKRLEELGYSVSLSVEELTNKKLPFEQILEAEKPAQKIKRFSFDVRA